MTGDGTRPADAGTAQVPEGAEVARVPAPSVAPTAGPRPVPQLDAIAGYVMGKPVPPAAERGAKLSSNENPFGPSPLGIAAAVAALPGVNRYPADPSSVRGRIAAVHGVAPDHVIATAGSDEVIHLVCAVYLEPGRRLVLGSPPYGIHRLAGQLSGAELVRIPLVDFVHDLPAMAAAARPGDVIAVTNPHNPTGTAVRPEAVRDLLAAAPRDCVVLVDEAYHEFMDDDVRVSAISMLDLHPGLIVSRTFSKAYGLAGLRIGYGIGRPETLEPMDRVRTPANVNAVGMAAAIAALDDHDHVERTVRLTRQGRDRLAAACDRLGVAHVQSQTNFVLMRDRDGWPEALAAQGIVVRPGANLGVPEWHRVTIGTPEEMDRVIAILERVLA
jgi:histidinol-phosphate aminotransferase